eukprot:362783-Chlamydomonas_euryale.AAC.8
MRTAAVQGEVYFTSWPTTPPAQGGARPLQAELCRLDPGGPLKRSAPKLGLVQKGRDSGDGSCHVLATNGARSRGRKAPGGRQGQLPKFLAEEHGATSATQARGSDAEMAAAHKEALASP